MLLGEVDDEALLDHRVQQVVRRGAGRSQARMIRSSGTGSGWLARNRSTRSARVAAGTWLMRARVALAAAASATAGGAGQPPVVGVDPLRLADLGPPAGPGPCPGRAGSRRPAPRPAGPSSRAACGTRLGGAGLAPRRARSRRTGPRPPAAGGRRGHGAAPAAPAHHGGHHDGEHDQHDDEHDDPADGSHGPSRVRSPGGPGIAVEVPRPRPVHACRGPRVSAARVPRAPAPAAAASRGRARRRERRGVPQCVIARPASGRHGGGGEELGGVLDAERPARPERARALGDRGEGEPVVGDRHHGGHHHQQHGDAPAEPGGAPERGHASRRRDGDPAQRAHPAADQVGEVADADPARTRRRPGRARPRRRRPPAPSWRSCTSQTRAKVQTTNCGTTSSTETPCTRARKRSCR